MARLRFVQALLLTIALTGGVTMWYEFAEPPQGKLREIVHEPLKKIFGPDVTYDWPFKVDFAEGVHITNLRVPSTGGFVDPESEDPLNPTVLNGLEAKRVTIMHDPIALAAGRFRPLRIEIEGARIITHETESGIDLDFPLDLAGEGHTDDELPEIMIRDVAVLYRAMPWSERLRGGSVLEVRIDELDLTKEENGRVIVDGKARTLRLGQDKTPITLSGVIERSGDAFELKATWDPLELTPELLDALNDDIASKLRQRAIQSGTLVLKLERAGAETERYQNDG